MKSEEEIYLYYGTQNLDLDIKYKIDPDYNSGKKFEFGNGFYLTPNRELAESYIRYKSILEKSNPNNRPALQDMINGLSVGGNLHVYKLSYERFKENADIKEFEGIEEYANVLRETLDGYNKDINYRPNRDATFGEICGQFWDDYWDEDNLNKEELSDEDLIKKCTDEMEKKDDKNQRQICINRKNVGVDKKNIFEEYLDKVECIRIY